jgi:hypothetical protein
LVDRGISDRFCVEVRAMGSIAAIQGLLEGYRVGVAEGLDKPDIAETEALFLLLDRDAIHDHWAELTPTQRQHVDESDQMLLAKHDRFTAMLPAPLSTDRARWWWFLHEGPQVREQAESLRSA